MLLRTELPYRADSAALFETVADLPWAVFLDSGGHHLTQSRYDIIAAEPHTTLVTHGKLTELTNRCIALERKTLDELKTFHDPGERGLSGQFASPSEARPCRNPRACTRHASSRGGGRCTFRGS